MSNLYNRYIICKQADRSLSFAFSLQRDPKRKCGFKAHELDLIRDETGSLIAYIDYHLRPSKTRMKEACQIKTYD